MNSRPIMARRIRSSLAVHHLALAVLALQLLPAPVRSADCTAYGDYFRWTGALVDPIHGEIARETPAISWPLAAGIQDRGNHVFLYDISNPKNIEFQGIIHPGKTPLAVALEDDLLAVWIKGSIQIYDVQSPRTPALRSEIPYPHQVLCCSGTLDLIDRLLYTTGRGDYTTFDPIAVFDLADPSSPVLLAELQIPSADHGIAVRNDIAYVACASRGIGLVDLRTRQHPTFLGFLQSNRGEVVNDVAIVSDRLLVMDRHLATDLVTYDLSIPTEPKEVHRMTDPTIKASYSISTSGDLLYVETRDYMAPSSALYRLDSEGVPTFLDFVPKAAHSSEIVGTTFFSGEKVAPLDQLEIATVAAQLPLRLSGLEVQDDVAFCGTYDGTTWLNAYSILDAEQPRVLDRLDITALNAYPKRMAITGDRLFYNSDSHVVSADISDPRDLRIVSRLQVWDQTLFSLDGIAATPGLVCATSRKYDDKAGVLHIFAWGEQSDPHEVGRIEGVWSGDPVFLDDATVIAARDGHPVLVDLSDPSSPQVVDSHPELTRAFCFATQGPIVYVGRYSVISILERTGKSSLDVVGHVGIGPTEDIAISGDRAYTRGRILDISDPRNPRLAGQLDVPYAQVMGGPPQVGAGTRTIVFGGNFIGLATAWSPCSPHSRLSRALDEDEDVLPDSELTISAGTPMALDVDPNPFTASLRINASVAANERLDVKIYDAAGRHVRTMSASPGAAGSRTVTWDGRDSGGRDVGAGVYFVRLQGASQEVTRRVVKLR